MTDPFVRPPDLSDAFESRARRRAAQLRSRRRASAVSAVALVVMLVGASFAVHAHGSHPDAKLHTAGVSSPEDASSTTRDDASTSTTDTTAPHRSTTAPGPPTTVVAAPATQQGDLPGAGGGAPDTVPAGGGLPEETTTSTAGAWPWTCPTPGTVTISTQVQAEEISAGRWHVTGTVTVKNDTGGGFGSFGYVVLAGATIPGTDFPAELGWSGTHEVMIGSNFSVRVAMAEAHSVANFPLSQDIEVDPVDGANALSSTAPTTVLNGSYMSTWNPPHMTCPGLNVVTEFTMTPFQIPEWAK